eukprot:3122737-Prymnesium_polylepis.1
MQGGGEVQAGPSGTATPVPPPPVVRGGRPLFPPFLPDCARRMRKKLQPCAWRHVLQKSVHVNPGSCMRRYNLSSHEKGELEILY